MTDLAPTLHPSWQITKPQVSSDGGIVAVQNYEAAQVGAQILAQGGNAMDAAVATAFALSVVGFCCTPACLARWRRWISTCARPRQLIRRITPWLAGPAAIGSTAAGQG